MGMITHEHPCVNGAQWQEAFTLRRDVERTVALSTLMWLPQAQGGKLDQLRFLATSQPPCVMEQSEFTLYDFSML